MKTHALALVAAVLIASGEVHAFDAAEQQTIDSLQQQIAVLQAKLDAYTGSEMTPADVVQLSWLVVACLAVGFSVKLLRSSL